MKRTLTYALSAVLGGAILTPALAQENFPDAQETHWAYEALLNMKKAGLLVGYPDGLFRGGRPASRYEMAVALHAVYQHLKNLTDGMQGKISSLDEQIKALANRGGGGPAGDFATKAELQQLRDALAATNAAVNGMKSWGDDIAAMKRMATTFERELASMGVDVEAMKKGMADLANRVKALEARKLPVDIHGTLTFIGQAGISEDDHFGITRDGRPIGVSKDDGGPAKGTKDLNIWDMGGFTLSTTNDSGPKGEATIVFGNTMASGSFSDGFFSGGAWLPSWGMTGVAYRDDEEMDVWIHKMQVTFATSIWGQDTKMRVGRVGYHAGPYTFMKPETSYDVKLPYFDGPDWIFDGFVAGLMFGNVGLDVFAGRQSGRLTSDGTDPWAMWAGNFGHPFEPGGDTGNNPNRPRGLGSNMNGIQVDQHLGFNANLPIGKGKLNLNYLFLDSNDTSNLGGSPVVLANRVTVYGGSIDLPVGGFNLNAGYSATNLNDDSDTVVDEDNAAWWVKASYKRGEKWGVDFGFRHIDPQFYAPGYWGRVGIWTNPTDVESAHIGGWFKLSDRTNVSFRKEFFRGADVSLGGSEGLSQDDKIRSFRLMLDHKISDSWTMWLGGEWVEWDLSDRFDSEDELVFEGGKPRERWYDLGFKYAFNENAYFSFLWQMSDYDGKGVFGMNPFSGFGDDKAKGHRKVLQLGVKF